MLELLAELIVETLGGAMPPRLSITLFSIVMFCAAAACFGFGAWVLYRAVTDPAEAAFLGLTGLAWGVGLALGVIGWVLFKGEIARRPRGS